MIQSSLTQNQAVSVTSWKYNLVNLIGDKLSSGVSLAENDLLTEAQRLTGLTDCGDDAFRLPLRVLLRSCEREARLNFIGRLITRRELIRLLANRLRIQADVKRYPEILKVPIRRPLFIIGLPRTGTTFLHRLLAQDPTTRTLQLWELIAPSPPPDRLTYDTDPRRKALQTGLLFWNWVLYSRRGRAQWKAIHSISYDSPEECWHLFENGFLASSFFMACRIPGYLEWLQNQDMTEAYQYYRQQLQILLWRCSADRLVLKSPMHLGYLDALLKVFPDAYVLWIHRDPLKVIPSLCSLFNIVRQRRSHHIDLKEIGRSVIDLAAGYVNHGVKVRDAIDSSQFLDVDYYEMTKDPIRMVYRIYEFVGDCLSDEAKSRMINWLDQNRQNRYGNHRYQLETFGLERSGMNGLFETYRQRFSIPFE